MIEFSWSGQHHQTLLRNLNILHLQLIYLCKKYSLARTNKHNREVWTSNNKQTVNQQTNVQKNSEKDGYPPNNNSPAQKKPALESKDEYDR